MPSMQSLSYFIQFNATVPLEEMLSEVVQAKNSCFIGLNNQSMVNFSNFPNWHNNSDSNSS